MKKITVFGAGLSTISLIEYLLKHADTYDWTIRVGDYDRQVAQEKVSGNSHGEAFRFDVNDGVQLKREVAAADVVVSMLPARFHHLIAKACVEQGKNMLTASYISEEMRALDELARAKGIGLYNELGVDPGIDHMSAMRVINKIRAEEGRLQAFFSSTGGLISPRYDNNPWHYKFTWNPRNVVLAGQGVSKFIRNGRIKYIPYQQLFSRISTTSVEGYGDFEIYPNRDSLSYRATYGLDDIPTIFRGTMRRRGYARAWDVFVQLGMTDDSYVMEGAETLTYRNFLNTFLPYDEQSSVEDKLKERLPGLIDEEVLEKLRYLDLFSHELIGLKQAVSPARVLQKILEDKWQLDEGDLDMIVMQHRFEYTDKEGNNHVDISEMVVEGKDKAHTAMAITVGTPLAIATKLVATGELDVPGVSAPVIPEIYEPVLEELKEYGVVFNEYHDREE